MPTTSLRIWQRRSMRSKVVRAAALMAAAISAGPVAPRVHAAAHTEAGVAADMVYRHGYVYTVDARDSVQTALAIRAGRLAWDLRGQRGRCAAMPISVRPRVMTSTSERPSLTRVHGSGRLSGITVMT